MTRWKTVSYRGLTMPLDQTNLFSVEEKRQPKPKTSSYKILQALKNAGHYGLYNHNLQEVGGLSWHRRVGNLREAGHNIRCERVSKGTFKYYLDED